MNPMAWDMWSLFWPANEEIVPTEIPLIASILYYSATFLLARFLRIFIHAYAYEKYHLYALDFVTAFEACACSLENSMLRRHYGYLGYSLNLIFLSYWYSLTFGENRANPCGNIVDYFINKADSNRVLKRSACQLVGGLLSFRYARLFWSLELTEGHGQRYQMTHCVTHLRVPIMFGFNVEFWGTFAETLLCLSTFSQFHIFENFMKVLISVFMVIVGINYTGMYMNPVNASNQTFGCKGLSIGEFLLVYWVAPLVASAIAAAAHVSFSAPRNIPYITPKTSDETPISPQPSIDSGYEDCSNDEAPIRRRVLCTTATSNLK